MQMIFYVAFRLKRKNARRRIAAKFILPDAERAKEDFKLFVESNKEPNNKQWELLTGDWKHIEYYEGMEKDEN